MNNAVSGSDENRSSRLIRIYAVWPLLFEFKFCRRKFCRLPFGVERVNLDNQKANMHSVRFTLDILNGGYFVFPIKWVPVTIEPRKGYDFS